MLQSIGNIYCQPSWVNSAGVSREAQQGVVICNCGRSSGGPLLTTCPQPTFRDRSPESFSAHYYEGRDGEADQVQHHHDCQNGFDFHHPQHG
jgi:hypothetical protein